MQNAIMVITDVIPERLEPLVELLRSIGDNIEDNPHMSFESVPQLHFCSLFIAGPSSERPFLVFEANIDGDTHEFLSRFVDQARSGLDEIYGHCQDYPTPDQDNERAVEYLLVHTKRVNTFFVGLPGMTLDRIRKEKVLRDRIESFLDRSKLHHQSPGEIRLAIQEYVRSDALLGCVTDEAPPEPFVVRYGKTVIICTLLLVGAIVLGLIVASIAAGVLVPLFGLIEVVLFVLVVAFAVWFVWRFRKLEETDEVAENVETIQPASGISRREDQQDLNHLANVAPIKPGWIRLTVLRSVLWVVDRAALYIFNRGELGGTATIHFARWVIINRNKDLLFLSSYDGSWENYLGDFVDKSSNGLTAIWSNTLEFPYTRWLVLEGASNEQPFKAAARRRQVASLVWYSAYPSLTNKNIMNNKAIRKELFKPLGEEQVAAWLRRF